MTSKRPALPPPATGAAATAEAAASATTAPAEAGRAAAGSGEQRGEREHVHECSTLPRRGRRGRASEDRSVNVHPPDRGAALEVPFSAMEALSPRPAGARPEPAATEGPAGAPTHLTPADRIELLRTMLLMRAIEARALTLYRQGRVPGSFYDGFGQEAVSVGAAFAMAAEDRLCILHRDLGAHLVRGVEPPRILAQYMGRASGVTRGRDGNVHFGDPALGCVAMVSMLPDMMCVATGMAMAFKLRGEARVALTFFGDGSTSRGDFHEAMNWAGVQRLPVVFVLENNQYAYSTPLGEAVRGRTRSSARACTGSPA